MQKSNLIQLQAEIPLTLAGSRLDQALATLFPEHSRSRLQTWISQGKVLVNRTRLRAKDKIEGGEQVEITAQLEQQIPDLWLAEALPLDIVFEDQDILIINKPINCVVHPACQNVSGTLVNALLHYLPALSQIPRAGIVHRLDKDTSGLLMVAKTLEAQANLTQQLQARTAKRTYEALVFGVILSGGSLETTIGRHPRDRTKMAIVEHGKVAITHYRVLTRFAHHTHLQLNLETGRTHQIRVHMKHLNYPIIGDKTYGGRLRIPPKASQQLLETLRTFPRQALHAKHLAILHPRYKKEMSWEIPLPEDMQQLLKVLREENRAEGCV